MNLGLKNSEGYYDLTSFEAINNVCKTEELKHKNVIYICSPLRGDFRRNQNKACGYCRFVISKGHIPIATHLLFPQFMDDCDVGERKKAIEMGLEILSRCDELWCFGKRISEGMAVELDFAKTYKIKIRHFTDCCEPILKRGVQI